MRTTRRAPLRPCFPAAALAAALTAAGLLTGCAAEDDAPELAAHGAFIPEPVTDRMAAGFFTVENTGGADDALLSVTSDLAGTVELHETTDGNAMRQAGSLSVPAGGELRLARGGDHLMLLDLGHRPVEGETVVLRLHFEVSEPLTVDVPVEAATHTGTARTG